MKVYVVILPKREPLLYTKTSEVLTALINWAPPRAGFNRSAFLRRAELWLLEATATAPLVVDDFEYGAGHAEVYACELNVGAS